MKRTTLFGAAVLMTVSAAAFAQVAPVAASGPAAAVPARLRADAVQQNGPGLRSEIKEDLEKAGFTGVTVMADSFVVQANDKSGNPVTMFLRRESLTVVSAEKTDAAAASVPAGGGIFTTIPAHDDLSSKIMGLDVYNTANENVGTIKDVAYTATGLKAYILGVGGILGLGDHYVAVRPSAVTISYNTTEKKWHAAMDTNAEALKAAPEYKYPNAS